MEWEKNSVLYNINPYTAPKEIFDAVCHEIGRYYQGRDGFKCLKRKLRWTGENVRCELGFWSSHYNMAGQYVAVEVVPNVYALDKTGMEKNGLLYLYLHNRFFDVHDIDTEGFQAIISFIESTIEFVKTLETKDGFAAFMERNKDNKLIAKSNNNLLFLERMME